MGYLVLTRGVGDTIEIEANGHTIRLQVAKLTGSSVKLAFRAPREVVILRGEVAEGDRRVA
jgi:carbon storage regulator CsrA